jgi:phosphopantetheine--protein transferase-like protein
MLPDRRSTNLTAMHEVKWSTVLNSARRDLSRGSWLVIAVTCPDLGPDRLGTLLDLAGDDGRRRWKTSGAGRAAVQSAVVDLLLRQLLSHITGRDASSLRFEVGPHGKPSLAGTAAAPHFNVSHCPSHGLIALSGRFEIGVDAEAVADYKRGVARRMLPPEDFATLDRLDDDERTRLFYELWVIKEACVKATGAGLSTPLRNVAVTLGAVEGRWGPVRWQTIDIGADASASVAVVVGDGDIPLNGERLYSIDAIEALGL